MDRRSFAGRLLLALGAIAAAGTSALSALVPGRHVEKRKVLYRAKWQVHRETGAVTPLNDDARAALQEHGPNVMDSVIAKVGLPPADRDNTFCSVFTVCNCGGNTYGCMCVPQGDMQCGTGGGSCSCCQDGSCCFCISENHVCQFFCPVYGCPC